MNSTRFCRLNHNTKRPASLRMTRTIGLILLTALAACKPPATDGFADRQMENTLSAGPSKPITSPDTQDAIWSRSAVSARILYGNPGEPPLLALVCDFSSDPRQLIFTRYAQADEGAEAFLALIGNGHVARIPVDAKEREGRTIWAGIADPKDPRMEAFSGGRTVTATIPGAGMVRLNASPLPGQLVEQCRTSSASDDTRDAQASPAKPDR